MRLHHWWLYSDYEDSVHYMVVLSKKKFRLWLYAWWLQERMDVMLDVKKKKKRGCYSLRGDRHIPVFFAATLCLVPSIRLRGDVRNMMAYEHKETIKPMLAHSREYVDSSSAENMFLCSVLLVHCSLLYINYCTLPIVTQFSCNVASSVSLFFHLLSLFMLSSIQ